MSTFASGNLVGQHSWTQLGTISAAAIQVSGGKAFFKGGLTASSQTAYKNFTLTNEAVYYGLTLTLTNTFNSTSVSYFTALYTSNNATGFANYRLSAKSVNAANTNYVLGVRVTGQSGNPYTFGTTPLTYGTEYRVIIQASALGTNMIAYVNPTSTSQAAQTQYANNPVGSGSPPLTLGSVVISEFGTTTLASDGGSIGKIVVADNFATVYNDLLGALPPVASFSGSPTSGTEPLTVTFSDTSTGTITNRFWDFGDASTTNTTTNSVVHTYAAGTYTVTLVTTGPAGSSTNTQTAYINVLTAFQTWQVQYFGSTNNSNAAPSVDADGTGQNNLFKYVAGLDPTNPASVFVLSVASVTNQVAQDNLMFNPLATGRTYTPQFSTDLVNDSWSPLPGYAGPVTNGGQVTITDTNAVGPQKFYRIDITYP
jgi:PKD repeat protein